MSRQLIYSAFDAESEDDDITLTVPMNGLVQWRAWNPHLRCLSVVFAPLLVLVLPRRTKFRAIPETSWNGRIEYEGRHRQI